MKKTSRLRWVIGAIVLAIPFACGDNDPNATNGADTRNTSNADPCATPNDGCACDEPGKVVECGSVKYRSGDYVACQMGTRTCAAGRWGACAGSDVVAHPSFVAGAPLKGLALGTGAPCPNDPTDPLSNVCDPYCNQFVDDPVGLTLDGGLVVTLEGGLTIDPGAVDGGGIPAGLQQTGTGDSTCGPAANVHTSPCNAAPLKSCQQDFRCDTASNTCVWNGGEGYYDSAAGGVDLTIGAACAGSLTRYVPLCNRGTGTVPEGTVLGINITNPPTPADGCAAIGPPDCSAPVPAGGLTPGRCMNVSCNISGDKFAVVNAGNRDVAEAAGRCANNAAFVATDGAPGCAACTTCSTQVSGKVYDPSGLTNNVPLAGISVFQPAGALKTFTDGVQCDTCTSLDSPSITKVITKADGSFTLNNVTPGNNIPIVVQSGRWRRRIALNVTACTNNTPAPGTLRMPKNRTDGLGGVADIPKIAVSMGSEEVLECGLLKFGIDPNEIKPRTAPADAHRIQLYRDNGFQTTPTSPTISTLYADKGPLNEYAAVLFDCHNSSGAVLHTSTAADRDRFRAYADNGGRLFIDHFPGEVLIRNGPATFAGTSTWQGSVAAPEPASGKILTPTPAQVVFRDWLANVSASVDYGAGWVRVDTPKKMALLPAAGKTVQWVRGESNSSPGKWATNPNGDYALSYSFETPVSAATTCGRVIYNGMHVSEQRIKKGKPATGKVFPTDCDLSFPLTPEEKTLEYQLFQLTACAIGGEPPPPEPPPPPPLPSVTYVRDYQAVCPAGNRVEWGYFYWQSTIPAGTSIQFAGATADTQAALPPAPPAGPPATVNIGTANATVLSPDWARGADTVATHLLKDSPGPQTKSKDWLRVYMTFQPTGSTSPILNAWRQVYDCVPAE